MNINPKKILLPAAVLIILAGFFLIRYYGDIFRPKTNVLLISVDTLRPDHLGAYGYGKNTSPAIDNLARDGLLFENCFSHAPNTWSSFSSLLSGFYPHETKVLKNPSLPGEVVTLPKILKRQGYSTLAVISNYVLRKSRGFAAGFDIYDDKMDDIELNRDKPERIARRTTNAAIKLLEEHSDEHVFMWIHYQDPHGPYTPPDPYSNLFVETPATPKELKVNETVSGVGGIPMYQPLSNHVDYDFYVAQYDGEIKYMDAELKRFLDKLKELGLYENSIIIFTSDHGEGMGERDYYFAHGEFLYKNLIHVPLIIKYGSELKGRRQDYVQHIDLVPTILNILGIEAEFNYRGLDLRQTTPTDRAIFSEMIYRKEYKSSIIYNQTKLILNLDTKTLEFYDHNQDPFEISNLIGNQKHLDTKKHLAGLLYDLMDEDLLGISAPNITKKLSKEEIRKLKSLGYVQ